MIYEVNGIAAAIKVLSSLALPSNIIVFFDIKGTANKKVILISFQAIVPIMLSVFHCTYMYMYLYLH